MDNRLISQIKRGLKVTTGYLMILIVFTVFSMPLLGLSGDNTPKVMPYVSFILFLLLFCSVYIEMRNIAFKEKRPQYNINPSPFKGLLYGFLGIIPLVIIQGILIMIQVPEDYTVLLRRVYQGLSGPLYWFARLLGNAPIHYMISFILVVFMAALGYYAGHKEFYLVAFIRNKLGIKKKVKKNRTPTR